jgi:hypothetical protein
MSGDEINLMIGLSIRQIGVSLFVKTVPSLPIVIQLNAFAGPALQAIDIVVVVVVAVGGACGPRSDWSSFFS